jgi:hypothetical protein
MYICFCFSDVPITRVELVATHNRIQPSAELDRVIPSQRLDVQIGLTEVLLLAVLAKCIKEELLGVFRPLRRSPLLAVSTLTVVAILLRSICKRS